MSELQPFTINIILVNLLSVKMIKKKNKEKQKKKQKKGW